MHLDRTFKFLGDRKYLQSASLFDDLLELRGADTTAIDMKFHRQTGNQVSYVDALPSPTIEPVAEWRDSGGTIHVIERDEPITESVPYDEPKLVQMLDVNGRVVDIPASTPSFTRISAMVGAFKLLLQTVYPDLKRKYVFARIRLAHCPQGAVQIRYARDIGPFFQGDIVADGKPLGQIFFGVW